MDAPSKHAIEFMETLISGNESLIEFAQRLRLRNGVKSVTHNIDLRRYRNGSAIEGYVDAELVTDRSIAWWFEIHWDENWVIESRIVVNHEQGQDILREFPDRSASTLQLCMEHLPIVIADLVHDANLINLVDI
jgi:hypothetical protein